ncbi:MAG: hypothetical protein IBJ11_02740 [Phycisphaerales bacterium]|nr:hypothetical protein [Phycisphaerales bacterium]
MAIAVMILVAVAELAVVSIVTRTGRDQGLTNRRIETVQSFYASEAGINMAMREMWQNTDEDGDGTIGGINSGTNRATDPAVGTARVYVTRTNSGSTMTLNSFARCGQAVNRAQSNLR